MDEPTLIKKQRSRGRKRGEPLPQKAAALMARKGMLFECTSCGAQSPKWLGRCTGCGDWNTLVEAATPSTGGRSSRAAQLPVALSEVSQRELERVPSSLQELDRVLGGGLVPGAVVLLGGDPGIGKSTLLMQALLGLGQGGHKVLYVTGEESASQVALRARRIGDPQGVMLLATTELSDVVAALEASQYSAVVVDSIQTVRSADLESSPGSVAQLREVGARLTELCKARSIAAFLIGHVTKEGALAGPKVLEHLVDVVLSFEGDATHAYRLLRGLKNRFGPTHEIGVFEMLGQGLREVSDPSALFLQRADGQAVGSAIVPTAEGSRSMLVEIQALLAPAQYGTPRRVVTGLDANRLALLLAVLSRKAAVQVLDQDVFASVAGGIRADEPAVDLAVCAAIVSALRERPLASGVLCFGELSLTGEVRAVPRVAARLSEARKHGFSRIVLPAASVEGLGAREVEGLLLLPAARLDEALSLLF